MDASPKGREIRPVEGEAGDIETRGRKIAELGDAMGSCADTLQMIASHDLANGEMDGKAVEKLQEKIGDSYETLREASQLYGPVGPIIEAYGKALGSVQGSISDQVQTCEDLWAKYDSLEGAPTHLIPGTEPEEGSPEAKEEEEAAQAREQARADWEDAAGTWDSYYDTWEDAYDEAVNGIGNEMAGKIEDGFWEVLDDIIAVLEIVALVLFVAALFLTGPFAAIAFAISAAILLARTVQFCAGECSLLELGLAALDVIPFGKFGKMADAMVELGEGASKLSKFSAALKVGSGFDDIGARVALKEFPDIVTGLHTGLDVSDFERIGRNGNLWAAAGEVQGALGKFAGSVYGNVNTAMDLPDWSPADLFT